MTQVANILPPDIEHHRWRLMSGYASLYLPKNLTSGDVEILRRQIDLLDDCVGPPVKPNTELGKDLHRLAEQARHERTAKEPA